MGYSNLKKFGNKTDNFNKKIKEVLPVTKKNKILKKTLLFDGDKKMPQKISEALLRLLA
jgi:hypothetical protein